MSELVTKMEEAELGHRILPGKDKSVKECLFLIVSMEKEPK